MCAAPGAEIHTPRVWWLSLCRQTGTVVLAVLLTLLGRGMRFENTNTPPLLFSGDVSEVSYITKPPTHLEKKLH